MPFLFPQIEKPTTVQELTTEPTNLETRLGNIIIAYNVFNHFYPYFDVIAVDWNEELMKALSKCKTSILVFYQ